MKHLTNVAMDDLLGKTFSKVILGEQDFNDAILFFGIDKVKYALTHRQDCCESVYIEDVVGDLSDLENSPILFSEDVSNSDVISDFPPIQESSSDESWTWTYYKISTIKGSVSIRFCGTSNGYYSETADLYLVVYFGG